MKTISALLAVGAVCGALLLVHSRISQAAVRSLPAGASAPADDALQQQVLSAEREGLDALKKGDVQHFGELTADEAVFVDDHGPASKAQVVKNVAGFTLSDYSIEDVKFVAISASTGLISYKIMEKGNSHGHEFAVQVYVSSIWTHRADKWLCLFSQETPVRKAAAAAGPAPSANQ